MNAKYQDILHQPHHVSKRHPQMPMHKRAAQFAPVTMVKAESPDAPDIVEYWSWSGDQSSNWIE